MKIRWGFGLLVPALALSAVAGMEAAPPAEDGPAVREVRLRAEAARAASGLRVEVEYRLRMAAGTEEIPLRGLAFAGTDFGEVEARLDGRPVELRLQRSGSLGRSGTIRLRPVGGAAGAGDVGAGNGRVRTLRLTYRVAGTSGDGPAVGDAGDSFDLRVPVLRVDWAPAGSGEGTFRAEVVLPSGARVTERLPTVPVTRDAAGERSVYSFHLPAVPSVIRLRGRVGPSPGLTLGQWVDLSVLATLTLLGLLGWRALRRA